MSCDCGCGDWNLSKADITVLKQLREGVLADLPMSIWQSLIVDVEKAGGVLAVEGTAGKVIREAVEKAKFASRSEAARYAAQQRWKGHAKEGDSKTKAPRPTSGSKGRAGKKTAPKPSSSAGRGDGTDVVGQEGSATVRFGEMSKSIEWAFSEETLVKAGLRLKSQGYGEKEATAAELKLGQDAKESLKKILGEEGIKVQEALDNLGKGFMPSLQISILEGSRGLLRRQAKATEREAKEKGLVPTQREENTVGSMVYTTKRTVLENMADYVDLELKRAKAMMSRQGKGETNDFIDYPDSDRAGRNTAPTTLRVKGKSRTYKPSEIKAKDIVKGDIVRIKSETEPRKVVGFVKDTTEDTSEGTPRVVIITQSLDPEDGRLRTSSSSGESGYLRFDEVVGKAMPQAAGDPRSNAGRYAAEQRWKGHTKKTEISANLRQQGKTPIAGGETNQDPSADVIDTLVEALSQYKAGNQVVVPADSVYTVLDELAKFAKDAKEKGDAATDLDLCKVSVPGTNLFCGENKGLLREEMPQLSGVPSKGSKADGLEKDKKGRVNVGEAFVERLRNGGVETREGEVPASSLKATQKQVIGADVAGIMKAMEDGSMPEQSIFVSRDGYVIDGHHRWAAAVGLDYKDGKGGDVKMKVRVIDLSIDEVLKQANAFADEMGMPRRSGDANTDAKRKGNDDVSGKGDGKGKGKDKKKNKGKKTEG